MSLACAVAVDDRPTSAELRPLSQRIREDRLDRLMTWHQYAAFLGVAVNTVRHIAFYPDFRPHRMTVAKIEQRMARR